MIVFEPPRRLAWPGRRLPRLGGSRTWWLLPALLAAGLLVGGWWTAQRLGGGAEAAAAPPTVTLSLTSHPPGARVSLDGRDQGVTPASLSVAPGLHEVGLAAAEALDGRYRLQVDAGAPAWLDVALWRRQAAVSRLRPALPGATLVSVDALDDGRLALGVAVPPAGDVQAWLLDPLGGGLTPVAGPPARGRLAVSPDGARLAWLAPGGTPEAPWSVWLAPLAGQPAVLAWRAAGGGIRPLDLAWTPDSQRLLMATGDDVATGGGRSDVWLLDASQATDGPPAPRLLVSVPSPIVPGSFMWSPDGQRVAFLTRLGSRRALCVLDVASAEFRYLADLDAPDTFEDAGLPFPPVGWSPRGHALVFVAPAADPPPGPFGWFERSLRRLVYRVGADDLVPRPIGPTDADLAVWREDGQSLVLLARLKDDGPLVLRAADERLGQLAPLQELPLRPAAFAARWDERHTRLLLASPSPLASGALDYTLVRLGLDDGQVED